MKGARSETETIDLSIISPTTAATSSNSPADEAADLLKRRAESLRRTADTMHQFVGQAYRRRAAELELQAWLTQLRAGCLVGPVAA